MMIPKEKTISSEYSTKMKMADMILADNNLLSILARLNVRLGLGETTVEEICRRYKLSAQLLLMICNIYSFDDYMPDKNLLHIGDLPDMLAYLKASHKYYTDKCFPRLSENMRRMVASCDPLNSKILYRFYDDYCSEVNKHFEYEDNTVFPYAESLLDNGGKPAGSLYDIGQFERNHGDIDEKLNDLKNIIIKYLPLQGDSDEQRIEVLNDIFRLEDDLSKHTLIENRLLIPLVQKLEDND